MTRLTRTALFALGVVAFAVAPAVADHHELPSAEDVIAAHIAAKGGADAWAAIDSLKLTGDFTAFSRISPFAPTRPGTANTTWPRSGATIRSRLALTEPRPGGTTT